MKDRISEVYHKIFKYTIQVLPNWSSDLTKWFENEEQLRNCVLFPAYRAAVKLTIGILFTISFGIC